MAELCKTDPVALPLRPFPFFRETTPLSTKTRGTTEAVPHGSSCSKTDLHFHATLFEQGTLGLRELDQRFVEFDDRVDFPALGVAQVGLILQDLERR